MPVAVLKIRKNDDSVAKPDSILTADIFLSVHGRENQHKDIGIEILNNTVKRMEELATVDGNMQSMGNRMFVTLVPKN